MSRMEIMAPAGSFESLMAAINSGADSVYFGVEQLNMRSRSANFILNDLNKIVKICNEHNVGSYLALNTIIYDHDMNLMKKVCDSAKSSGVTAVIAFDIAVMQYAKSISLNVHCSTQLNISNIEAVKFFSQFSDVIVLARELTLKQIKNICDEIKEKNVKGPSGDILKIEVFCHGALCVAISGKCYMSLATYNASANRGACLQNCRRSYRVIDEETGDELVVDNKYVMSPSDLCTVGMLDLLSSAGVSILKIEGRGRSPEYVSTVVRTYKEAIKSLETGDYTKENLDKWIGDLESVYNRGFWHGGYYLGKNLGEWSNSYGSKATREKKLVGVVDNYYSKNDVVEIILDSGDINIDKEILIIGPTTGVLQFKPENIFIDNKEVISADKGSRVTIKVNKKVRRNDKVYVLNKR